MEEQDIQKMQEDIASLNKTIMKLNKKVEDLDQQLFRLKIQVNYKPEKVGFSDGAPVKSVLGPSIGDLYNNKVITSYPVVKRPPEE
jgi:predicted RNase H-like nuclease (RuvC/YqgF family)